MGRSRGGLTTKVHLIVDAIGLPLRFQVTEGERHDSLPAKALFRAVDTRCLLADRAYDSDEIREALALAGAQAVIPGRRSRAKKIDFDRDLYKARSEVECTFNLLKQARRFATRYEKTVRNYIGIIALSCAMLWLR